MTTNRIHVTGTNNPAEFHAALRANPGFRLRFADRVHRHFFHGGALTPEAAAARYQALTSAFRDRVGDRATGNTLSFDGGDAPSRVQVDRTGTGYAELDVVAGCTLRDTLEL